MPKMYKLPPETIAEYSLNIRKKLMTLSLLP